jgi:GNAT superfamily N-acetyltransferase
LSPEDRAKREAEVAAEKAQKAQENTNKNGNNMVVGAEDGQMDRKNETGDKWPQGANEEACELYFGLLGHMRDTYAHQDYDYVLRFLATDPEFQRRGLGGMLLRQGIERADAEGRRIYLEATEAGRPLYEKLGWKDIDLVSVDLRKWGEERPGLNYIMMREPRTSG